MVRTLGHTLPNECAEFSSETVFPVRVENVERHLNISVDHKAGSLFSEQSVQTLGTHIRFGKKRAQGKGSMHITPASCPLFVVRCFGWIA